MAWKTIDDFDLAGKTVVTRVDLNIPVTNGTVTDTTRIERVVPTILEMRGKGARVVLLAHFGRPEGQPRPDMSLRQVLPALEAALGCPVTFLERPDRASVTALPGDAVVLAENTRFSDMEEKNDAKMARFLAGLGDYFCNDAFSAAHRAHASTEGIARLLPSFAGRLMEAELRALEKALTNPARPVMAVIGGAKISTKLELLGNLVRKVDQLVIGGAMANTFLGAQGLPVGKSLCEPDLYATALDILHRAEDVGCDIVLPIDVVVADQLKAGAKFRVLRPEEVSAEDLILDAGPASVARITDLMENAQTLVWNGPLGAFETPPFDQATVSAARRAAELTRAGRLLSVAGGGDTVAALNAAEAAEDFTYVSTAGGAFLEWLEGKTLPGIAALEI